MIELQHLNEPPSLIRYRSRAPHAPWGQADFVPVRDDIRHSLHAEQDGLCVYCETSLTPDKSHVEHIKPKGTYPGLTYDFKNLALSCNEPTHCGHFKKNREIAVEPRSGCNEYFQLMTSDGKLVPAADLSDSDRHDALQTIEVLGLNTPALARQRQQFAATVQFLQKDEVGDFLSTAQFRHTLQRI